MNRIDMLQNQLHKAMLLHHRQEIEMGALGVPEAAFVLLHHVRKLVIGWLVFGLFLHPGFAPSEAVQCGHVVFRSTFRGVLEQSVRRNQIRS